MSTHPNHRRGHGRIPPHGCGRPGCEVCSAKRKPDPPPERVAVAEGLAEVIDDAPDPVTGESAWRALWDEVWGDTLDETTVGAEVIRDDYSRAPVGAEVQDE